MHACPALKRLKSNQPFRGGYKSCILVLASGKVKHSAQKDAEATPEARGFFHFRMLSFTFH